MNRNFFALICTATAIATLFAASARAGFVLDDFDDPAEVVSPEMHEDTLVTQEVGVLSATRELRIASAAGTPDPDAILDVSGAAPGMMTAALRDLHASIPNPLFAFQFNYIFEPTDVSEMGANDAILFDFASIAGTQPPSFLRAIVTDDTFVRSRFEARIYNIPVSSNGFTAVMPFSSFTIRGGTPGLPDFTAFKRIDFDFYFLFPNPDIQWSTQIDRIRFGRVPEPASLGLCLVGAGCISAGATRRRSESSTQRRAVRCYGDNLET